MGSSPARAAGGVPGGRRGAAVTGFRREVRGGPARGIARAARSLRVPGQLPRSSRARRPPRAPAAQGIRNEWARIAFVLGAAGRGGRVKENPPPRKFMSPNSRKWSLCVVVRHRAKFVPA